MTQKLLGFSDLKARGITLSRSQIYRLIGRKRFPKPVRMGERAVAFVEKEIDDYIAGRIAERDGEAT
jgi:prophage regulatory protein